MTDKIPDPFFLTDGEKASPLWQKLTAELETRLKNQRGKNDDPKLSEQETAAIRGHIACLKGLIALGKQPPLVE